MSYQFYSPLINSIFNRIIIYLNCIISSMPINKFCGLYQAIKHNNIKVVKFFIENNENVEIAAFYGKTSLIINE